MNNSKIQLGNFVKEKISMDKSHKQNVEQKCLAQKHAYCMIPHSILLKSGVNI